MTRYFCLFFLTCLIITSSHSIADIHWFATEPSYQLKAFHIFRIKKQITEEQYKALSILRDEAFSSSIEFNEAVENALLSRSLQIDRQFIEQLNALAIGDTGFIGFEFVRDDFVSLYFSEKPELINEEIGITAKSWINFPEHKTSNITKQRSNNWQSKNISITHNNRCLSLTDRFIDQPLFNFCQSKQPKSGTAVDIKFNQISHIYGLGQQFHDAGSTLVNRMNHRIDNLNIMEGFNGGANGNTNFPVAYALGRDSNGVDKQFLMLLDNRFPNKWDLKAENSKISVTDGDFVIHIITGKSLEMLRRKFMAISGKANIPPKSMFGLWLSEYGFDNWSELDDKLMTLKKNHFPISGVVMDLQWFGGINGDSQMGSLTWDRKNFPAPEEKIRELRQNGIEMMLIEESYVDKKLEEHQILAERGYLATDIKNQSHSVNPNGGSMWWGDGGMIDWLQPEAGDFWHDYRRQDLIDMGVIGHWTDLGEPEMFNSEFNYGADSLNQTQAHNSYNLEWIESINRGYIRHHSKQRPNILSRSGGIGMQSLGAIMWSGDIGSDFGSLSAQMPQQTHMFWSGIDYYGSDIGGFHRAGLKSGVNDREKMLSDLYTQWLAYAALVEIPIRPHTENLCNCKETAPDRIGNLKSNRANIQLRYELIPYYYSLAHRAYMNGDAVFAPLVHYYQKDQNTWDIGHQKMIGSQLLMAGLSEYEQQSVPVYLPEGTWFDYRTGASKKSTGEFFEDTVYRDSMLQLPLFATNGAIIPTTINNQLVLKVFGDKHNRFVWSDDDGVTINYREGELQSIEFIVSGSQLTGTTLNSGLLSFKEIHWYLEETKQVSEIQQNNRSLDSAMWQQSGNLLVIKAGFESNTTYKLKFN